MTSTTALISGSDDAGDAGAHRRGGATKKVGPSRRHPPGLMKRWVLLAAPLCLMVFSSQCQPADEGEQLLIYFRDVSLQSGMTALAPTYDAAAGDFDGDGLLDLYVGNHGAGAALYRNQGNGTFVNVIKESGIVPYGDQHGTAWGDYDNDGRLDLYVSLGAFRGKGEKANRLYRNMGEGKFVDMAAAAGTTDPRGRSRSVSWVDFDNDGNLDLFLANFLTPNVLLHNNGDGTFADVSSEVGIDTPAARHSSWGDYDRDGYADLLLTGLEKGAVLYRNVDGKHFRDVTAEVGLKEPYTARGSAWGDYDNDGDLDLHIARGLGFVDTLLSSEEKITFAFFAKDKPVGFDFAVKQGKVTFDLYENGVAVSPTIVFAGPSEEQAESVPMVMRNEEMSNLVGPPGFKSGNGYYLWKDSAKELWHFRWKGAGDHHLSGIISGSVLPSASEPIGFYEAPQGGSVLYENTGSSFEDVTRRAKLEMPGNAQTGSWGDFDNDGHIDVQVVNSGVDGRDEPDYLYWNTGQGTFDEIGAEVGTALPEMPGRGCGSQWGDFDGNGFLDLFLTNGWGAPPFDRGPHKLLKSSGDNRNNWVEIVLEGQASNRQGLGAWVEILTKDHMQVRYHTGGSNYFSQSVTPLHFGLGTATTVQRITIRWPSGVRQQLENVEVNRRMHVVEDM